MKYLLIITIVVMSYVVGAQTLSWDASENAEGYRINYAIIENDTECNSEGTLPYSANVGNVLSYDLADDINFQINRYYKLQISGHTYNGKINGPLSEDVYCIKIGEIEIEDVEVKKKSPPKGR
jgi:hypothetical protein